MGKDRKQQLQEYQYDEASSGSDDSGSSNEEDIDELRTVGGNFANNVDHRQRQKSFIDNNDNDAVQKDQSSSDSSDDGDGDDSESDSTDNSTDSSVDSENEEENGKNRDHDINKESPDSDDDSVHEQDDNTSDEEDAPLHQRLQKKESRGSLQRSSRREKKSRALEEATKRLASFKETQRLKKKRKTMGVGHEDDESVETSSNRKTIPNTITKKKKNKHKPTEVSSKRADFFARGARRLNESGLGVDIGAHRYKPMDPRASTLTGHFDEDRFHNNFAFLEEMRNQEIGQVRKRIAAHKATGNKGNRMRRKLQITQADGTHSSTLEEDVARLKALTETRANLERRKIDRAARQSVKRKIREDVESGKTGAYFLKRKEKKRLELEARYEEIRKRGGEKAVEKILTRRRQKNKSRDASAFAK
jgi:ribosomal RNA-processing protein 36